MPHPSFLFDKIIIDHKHWLSLFFFQIFINISHQHQWCSQQKPQQKVENVTQNLFFSKSTQLQNNTLKNYDTNHFS